MTALQTYSTGTASVATDGTVVTGVGPLWLTAGNAKPGDLFQSGHYCVPITDVTDETHLVITPWPGGTLAGATYSILKVSQQRIIGAAAAEDVDKMLTALNTNGWYVFVPSISTVPDPSLGDDGQFALQASTGKVWAKESGVWNYLGIYKAFRLMGAWSGATAYSVGDVVTLNGTSYSCVLDHTNQTPPNSTYWQVLAAKGDTGPAAWGTPAAWVTATPYSIGPPAAVVTFNGNTYVALVSHTSGTFATDLAAGKWLLVAQRGQDGSNYAATSTTSLAIGTGTKSFTTQTNLAYTAGARIRLSHAADVTKYMEGLVTAYTAGTGAMTVNILLAVSSGTFTDWNLNLAGEPGTADFVTVRKFEYKITSVTNTVSGTDLNGSTLAYTPGFLDVVVNGSTAAPSDITATNGTSVVFSRNLNIGDTVYINASLAYNPADALSITAAGSDITNKPLFRRNLGVQSKNYILNGAMMVSQENAAVAGTTSGYYPVDQFTVNFVTSGALSVGQVASLTPGGSPNRLRITVTSADAAVAAGDLLVAETRLEGQRIADLRSGSASAKTVTLQFGVKGPAGTYGVGFRNGAATRNYAAEFTIAPGEANTDVVKSVTLALDQSGTWANDTSLGIIINFVLMGGTNFQVSPNAWGSATVGITTSNQFNFMGTNGNVFELFDVGLYEGATAPSFQVPDYPSELLGCQRYYEACPFVAQDQAGTVSGKGRSWPLSFKVSKRATPTTSIINLAQTRCSGTTTSSATSEGMRIVTTNSNTDQDDFSASGTWIANARL